MLDGPLHWLGCRLGLVRGGTNTVRLGLTLGTLAWGVLLLLALMEGYGAKVFSLGVIGIHVRLLVAIPLFFLCETWVFRQMAEFARYIVRSGLVPETSLPDLESDIRRVGRMADSWFAEAAFLLAAFALPLIEMVTQVPVGRTGSWCRSFIRPGEHLPGHLAGIWVFACRSFDFWCFAGFGGWGSGGTSFGT